MSVYIDSKDLINLLNGSTPVHIEDFTAELRAGSHHLTVSFMIIDIYGRKLCLICG